MRSSICCSSQLDRRTRQLKRKSRRYINIFSILAQLADERASGRESKQTASRRTRKPLSNQLGRSLIRREQEEEDESGIENETGNGNEEQQQQHPQRQRRRRTSDPVRSICFSLLAARLLSQDKTLYLVFVGLSTCARLEFSSSKPNRAHERSKEI